MKQFIHSLFVRRSMGLLSLEQIRAIVEAMFGMQLVPFWLSDAEIEDPLLDGFILE